MKKSKWHRDSPSPGRHYYLPKDIYYKYDEKDDIVDKITQGLREFLHISPAVRILTDTKYSDTERLYLEIPYNPEKMNKLLSNVGDLLYRAFMGYYISADPKSSHFGISNWLLEGNFNSFLIRELEKLFSQFRLREDMAGRLVRDADFEVQTTHQAGDNFFFDIIHEGVDIAVGYSLTLFGSKVNASNLFVPLDCGEKVIEQLYYNLENIILQNFSMYDEMNTGDYLKISNTLIFKEVVDIMKRAKKKEHTRKKLLNGMAFESVLTNAENQLYGRLIGDTVLDTLNHIDDPRIKAACDRSRVLFNDFMIKGAEITNSSVNVNELTLSGVSSDRVVPSPTTSHETESSEKVPAGRPRRRGGKMQKDDLQEL